MDGDTDGFDGTLAGYLNGQAFGEATGVGTLFRHPQSTGLGFFDLRTAFPGENSPRGRGMRFAGVIDEVTLYNTALPEDRIQAQYTAAVGAGDAPMVAAAVRFEAARAPWMAGDANMDYQFNQLDLVQVQIAAKYLTGLAATWGEGDWNGAPTACLCDPTAGDGLFDQLDIVAALQAGAYLTGPYTAITDDNIFEATFGNDTRPLSFSEVAQAGFGEDISPNVPSVMAATAGTGGLGEVDLIYVPEPATFVLLGLALTGALLMRADSYEQHRVGSAPTTRPR
jgi:hypothetical protein